MIYKKLGPTGAKVSSLCLGTMTFGDGADEAMSGEIYSLCRDKGLNFFDTADVYAEGQSEKILGRLIKGHRDEVVIASKAYYPTSDDINDRGLSRYHLTRALDRSLKNMGVDYLDVYYMHCFDEETPLEESLATFNDFIQQGKILYIGLSNFAAWQVMKAIGLCKDFNAASIACIQPMYSLLKRQCESELLPMAISEGLGVFSYSPLGGGYLTGKYLTNKTTKGRFDTDEMYQKRYKDQSNLTTVELFTKFAQDNGFNPVSLAIAWAASHPGITAPLIGARNIDQLKPALASLDLTLTPEMRETISGFSQPPAMATDREEERRNPNTLK